MSIASQLIAQRKKQLIYEAIASQSQEDSSTKPIIVITVSEGKIVDVPEELYEWVGASYFEFNKRFSPRYNIIALNEVHSEIIDTEIV